MWKRDFALNAVRHLSHHALVLGGKIESLCISKGIVPTAKQLPGIIRPNPTAFSLQPNRLCIMSLSIQERASRYIARMDAAVSGSGGHDATFAVACALVHGFDLGEGDAMALMQEFNSRCAPPWSERDLAYKLRSAAGFSSPRGRGYLLNGKAEGERLIANS